MVKHPAIRDRVKNILYSYKQAGQHGCFQDDDSLAQRKSAPPPGAEGRTDFASPIHIYRPIRLILHDIHPNRAALDSNPFIIRHASRAPIHIMDMSWQHLQVYATDLAISARNNFACRNRSLLYRFEEIDVDVMHAALANTKEHQPRVVRHHTSLGAIHHDIFNHFMHQSEPTKCDLCHQSGAIHM